MKQLPLIILPLLLCATVYAKDLGRLGATFEIGEVDMLSWIETRLRRFDETGKLAQMQDEFTEQVKRSVNTPTPVEIGRTSKPDVFYVDPSLTLAKDIVLPQSGVVIAKAGQRINPFDTTTWPQGVDLPQFEYQKTLVFFDGRDHQQLEWAKGFKSDLPIKWILTGGSPNDVATVLNTRLYFAQQGDMTRRMHIKAVPSVVRQKGHYWQVREIDVSEQDSAAPLDTAVPIQAIEGTQ